MPYYEDVEIGDKYNTPRRTITDGIASILIDVGGYTANIFTDKIAAEKTPIGWRAIPGRLILGIMGGLVEKLEFIDTPGPGMLVGCDKLKWKAPLHVGDTVYVEWEITEKRKTSNPRWGLVINKETMINQNDEVICTVEISHLFEYRKNADQ
ncbi:MAG: MaoC family dehydratase N-terminal domain-containing protein [Thermodesulfobacteriota bacterium]|nr:MaoC family dehydratase N-terminal domain-containing protein [Thermodesulfobacteriota bacterium]